MDSKYYTDNFGSIIRGEKQRKEPKQTLPISKIQLLTVLSNYAKGFHKDEHCGVSSVIRNEHMNTLTKEEQDNLSTNVVDAVVVDFINYIGMVFGVDYAMYTSDLEKEVENPNG